MKSSLKASLVLLLALLAVSTAKRAAAFPIYPNLGPNAASPNQAGVANSLSQIDIFGFPPFIPFSPMGAMVNQINLMPAAQQQEAFKQLAPLQYAGMFPGGAAPGSAAQTGAVFDRLARLRSERAEAVALNVEGKQWYPGTALASAIGDTDTGLLSDPSKKVGAWGTLTGALGRQYGQPDALGYSFNGAGFSMGADYRVAEGLILGVSGAMLRSHTKVDAGSGTNDGRSYKYGVYGSAASGPWHADAYVGGGLDFFTARRNIAFLGLTAGSDPQGHEINAKAGAGYDAKAGRLVVTPFVEVSHDRMNVAGFGETGAGVADLNVAAFTLKSTKSVLGFRVKRAEGGFRPYASLAYQHEYETDTILTSSFAGGGPTFSTALARPSPEAALAGLGFDARLAANLAARLGYDGEYRCGYLSHGVNAGLRLAF